MSGLICLQGGDEFMPCCRAMDEAWLERAGRGVVAITPLACAAGMEYRTAARNGAEYLRELGLTDIVVAPEPDVSLRGTVHAIIDSDIVVIPGGSPARIVKRVIHTAVGGALRAHLAGGGTLIGASAGAMVLGEMMVVPGDEMHVRPALGAVPGVLVLPHYDAPHHDVVRRLSSQVDDGVTIVGIPSCCGVLFGDGDPVALGPESSWRLTADGEPTAIPRPNGPGERSDRHV